MKTTLFIILCTIVFAPLYVSAQQFLPTAATPCVSCHPAGYTNNGTPDISTTKYLGGDFTQTWQTPGFTSLPNPPSLYSQGLPANAGQNSFVSLATSDGIYDEKVSLTLGGFTPGKDYTLIYSVLSGSVYDPSLQTYSNFGEEAKLEILTTTQTPVKSQATSFDVNTRNKWITKSISFKPTTTTLVFKFSGHTTGNTPGYINVDIDNHALCPMPTTDVQLQRSTINTIFTGDKIDLNNVATLGTKPAGCEIVWKQGPSANDIKMTAAEASSAPISNQDPQKIKPYYAFYYNTSASCYSVASSDAELQFLQKPTQVPLKSDQISVSCAQPNGDLNSLLDNPAANVIWLDSPDLQGSVVGNPGAAPAGDYYAYYFDINKGGYSLKTGDVSSAHVKITNPLVPGIPNLGPTLEINSLSFAPVAFKDFVVKIHNVVQQNSGCSVYFLVSKVPGYNIQYNAQAGQSNVDGGIANNNDKWSFSETADFIKVTSKVGLQAGETSVIGFKISRLGTTTSGTTQNLNVFIPAQGGGGELIFDNNQLVKSLIAN